ncbi:MAG: helix-turn-helix domain-containing protein [Bosea sp. (in: a-proteobacteria)]
MSLSKLIPIGEALPFIGLRKSAIYDLIKAGELQATKIGSRTFITEDEFARYRAANERKIGRAA